MSSGAQQVPANLGVTLDQMALSVQLMATATVHVSVAPNGYSGPVALSAGTMPTGLTAAFDNATLTLDGESAGTATLTITTATSTPPGDVPLSVSASAGGATFSTALALTVQSVITLHIPAGVNNMGATVSNPNTTAYGPYPISIVAPAGLSASNPVTVYFQNDDNVSHEIHADDQAQGFGHDPGSFGAGKMDPYVRQVNAAGTYDFYLHDQGSPITPGRVFIEASQ
jgi:plastocyanin